MQPLNRVQTFIITINFHRLMMLVQVHKEPPKLFSLCSPSISPKPQLCSELVPHSGFPLKQRFHLKSPDVAEAQTFRTSYCLSNFVTVTNISMTKFSKSKLVISSFFFPVSAHACLASANVASCRPLSFVLR